MRWVRRSLDFILRWLLVRVLSSKRTTATTLDGFDIYGTGAFQLLIQDALEFIRRADPDFLTRQLTRRNLVVGYHQQYCMRSIGAGGSVINDSFIGFGADAIIALLVIMLHSERLLMDWNSKNGMNSVVQNSLSSTARWLEEHDCDPTILAKIFRIAGK